MLRWLTGQSCSHKIVKDASSNSTHRESHRGRMKEVGKHPFELCSPCMHTVLPVEAYGRGNINRGTVESPHGGTPGRKSHASVSWLWWPFIYDFVGTD